MLGFRNDAHNPRQPSRLAVPARLALHQDEFNVILDDTIRLVGFTEKATASFNFVLRVGNLVPDDRSEVVIPNAPTLLLN